MAACHQVYDSRHLLADCQKPGSAAEPTLGNRVQATLLCLDIMCKHDKTGNKPELLLCNTSLQRQSAQYHAACWWRHLVNGNKE